MTWVADEMIKERYMLLESTICCTFTPSVECLIFPAETTNLTYHPSDIQSVTPIKVKTLNLCYLVPVYMTGYSKRSHLCSKRKYKQQIMDALNKLLLKKNI